MIRNSVEKWKEDGSIYSLKWILTSMVVLFFVGYVVAGAQVLFLEQTRDGKYAVHNECVEWDEDCIRSCEDEYDVRPHSCESCCIRYDYQVDPIGYRMKEIGGLYGFVAAVGPGILIGATIADQRWKDKRFKAAKRSYAEVKET